MSPYSGSKRVEEEEEEELDLFYLEIEERIMLLISEEEEEEEEVKKKERARVPLLPSNKYSSFSFIKQLQPSKQRPGDYYGGENMGKKNKPWIHEYCERNIGGRRMSEISGRRGTGVFIPKSIAHTCN